jgi:hypothetical protein
MVICYWDEKIIISNQQDFEDICSSAPDKLKITLVIDE